MQALLDINNTEIIKTKLKKNIKRDDNEKVF